MNSAIDQFRAAIAAAGLPAPDEIHDDGAMHRFSTSGKATDKSGWYVLHGDGIPAGSFGCWRTGLYSTWCSKATTEMTQAERDANAQRIRAMQAQREADQAQRQKDAAQSASELWAQAEPAPADHPYLVRKGIQPHGARVFGDYLLVPLRDAAGALHSLQTIAPDGEKRFHTGGRIKGCYFSIGRPDGVLVICEGFGTGASINQATGHAVAVAFNAGNVLEVAQALRSKYPALRVIVAADDDWRTEGNPGMTKAREAAQAVGALLAVPVFSGERPDKATDFNDLAALDGPGAVLQCFDSAISPIASSEGGVSAGAGFEPLPEPAAERAPDSVVLACGADLTPEPVRWLWQYWLALGKLHILAGAPGQGKTTIAMAMAATITIGGRWPDGTRCEAGNVLVWSGEDDPADTLVPRLMAAGADRNRCHFIQGTRRDGEVLPFDPARDMRQLQDAIRKIGGIRLLVIDPVVSAVTGDSHKNTEVRRALQPLVDLAAACDCALLGITHFAKGGQGSDPAQRVVGSVAFTAVARVVLVAAKVKGMDGEDSRILARGKSNIGPDDGGFEYHMEQCEPLPGLQASRIAWGKAVQGSARDLLTDPNEEAGDGESASAKSEAEEFLLELLKDGSAPSKYVESEAKAAGIAWITVRRASDALGIKKRKLNGAWYWFRPEFLPQPTQLAHVAHVSDVEQVEQVHEQVAQNSNLLIQVAHVAQPSKHEQVEQVAPDLGDGEWEVI